MGSVASELKSAREKQNISLAQIAAETRISLHYLESLEEGRYGELPGGMYNRAFLRAYCERLNLNQQDILSRYEAEVTPPLDKLLKSKIHLGQKDTSLKINPVLIWSLMLLISATGLFFSRKWIAEVFSPYFSRRPSAIISPDVAKPPTPAVPAGASAPVAMPAAPSETSPAQSSDSTVASSPEPPPSISGGPSEKSLELSTPPSQAPLRLEIGTSEKCWVSVDRDGTPAFRKLMEAGENQSLAADKQFLLVVGNAGGVHLKINGKPAKPLGKPGEVVKILINENNLRDLLDQTAG